MGELCIRPAQSTDASVVAALFDGYRQFYGRASNVDAAQAFIGARLAAQDSVILLALVDGQAAGFTQLYPSFSSVGMARIFVLNDLFVLPDARRAGVGRALLQAAADHARGQGALRLTLSTATDNVHAQALYESQGWQRDHQFWVYNFPLMA